LIQEHELTEGEIDNLSDAAIARYYLRPWKNQSVQTTDRPAICNRIDAMLAKGMSKDDIRAALKAAKDAKLKKVADRRAARAEKRKRA
jgi:hypothetical protein